MRIWQRAGLLLMAAALLSACAIVHSKPNLPSRDQITPGQTITVQGNQNVYAVAREHNVSMRDIIVLNNLQPPYNLHPGQSLVLPSGSSGGYYGNYNSGGDFRNGVAPQPTPAPSGAIETAPLAPLDMKPIQSEPLPPPSTTPTFPSKQSGLVPPKSAPVTQGPVESLNQPSAVQKPVATTATNLNKPETAPAPPPSTSAPAAEPTPSTTMRWPVQGPILSGFGPKGQGLNNDGINIGAPKGSPVVAAANGIVVYAGNEMKGFGNLVLIRHKDGWVTAYAHLDRTLVQKDGVVAQGDEIGTVGKTGNVPSPQLHFETRYEGKPVDPSTVIKAQ